MANPYQLSSIRTNLDSLRNIQGMDRQQSLIDVLNQKQKISEDYEKDVEAIQKDARDRAGKHSGILKGIKGIATLNNKNQELKCFKIKQWIDILEIL